MANVAGRSEMLSATFFLAAILTYHKVLATSTAAHHYMSPSRYQWSAFIWLAACIASGAAATLCKEQGIMCLGVCAVHDMFTVGRICFRKDERRRLGKGKRHVLLHPCFPVSNIGRT